MRISDTAGRTWSAPVRLVDLPNTDNGYPASLQLDDGTLVVAYYAGRCEAHDRYHMGVLRLEPGELLDG